MPAVLREAEGSATAAQPMDTLQPSTAPLPAAGDLTIRSESTWRARHGQAVADLEAGARLWPLALTLGWFDIRLRYRGSVLGPFWLTLSTAVMVVALGVLYSTLFKMELHDYLPYLAISLVLWNTLGGIVAEACTCFLQAEGLIRSIRMPYTLYAARVLVRNVIVFGHNLVVIVAVYAWFDTWPGMGGLRALPGFALWLVDGMAACLLLGAVCARFRDIPPIVASVMQIAFFVSPILWKPELLTGAKRELLPLNPFFTLLEVVRAPLLGEHAGLVVWYSATAYSLVLVGLAWLAFTRVRGRLAFWV